MTNSVRRTALLIALGFVVLRLPSLIDAYDIEDEAVYAVVAGEWLAGSRLYVDTFERRPPLLFAAYAGVLSIGGQHNMRAIHAAAVLWTLLTMAGLFVVARRLFDARAGLVAAALYGVYAGFGRYTNLCWNGELLLNMPLVWGIALAFRNTPSRVRPELLAAGALIACAFLFKQPAAAAAVALGLYLLLPSYRRARNLTVASSLVHAALFSAGFAAVIGVTAYYLHSEGLLQEALYWVLRHHDMPHGPTDVVFWERLVVGGVWFALCCFPLLAAAAASLSGRRRWVSWQGLEAERFAVLLLLATAMLGVCASGRFYMHYFILLLPALALAAAPAVALLLAGAPPISDGVWPLRPRPMRGVLIASAVVFFALHVAGFVKHQKGNEAARYIRAHSTAADRIFVWGEQPRVYLESQRRPASRYVGTYPLTGHPYGGAISYDPVYPDTTARIVPGAWENLERDLAANPPRYVVDVEATLRLPRYPVTKFPRFARWLVQNYRQVFQARDGIIYERTTASPSG